MLVIADPPPPIHPSSTAENTERKSTDICRSSQRFSPARLGYAPYRPPFTPVPMRNWQLAAPWSVPAESLA